MKRLTMEMSLSSSLGSDMIVGYQQIVLAPFTEFDSVCSHVFDRELRPNRPKALL